ncbi:MAG TPA: GNAT family N-acetyltransferase [Chitinolyticbacter sp.]|nr:GNAT family N-acetyltransferase [Chitinolyticbacter sp.]
MHAEIAQLEALALSAWPALASELVDGWVMRFANGYTKRANSVVPLYPAEQPDEAKIAYVEARYGKAGLPCIFKLTEQARVLDTRLAQRGYELVDPTSVQTTDLATLTLDLDPAVTLADTPHDGWFDAFVRISGLDPAQGATATQLLARYAAPTAFAVLHEAGEPVACGFAVRQWDSVLLFDIYTHPAARRRGHAARVVARLLAWGRDAGAARGLLQVVAANAAARALYARFGYTEQYQHWYRRQPRCGERT